MSELDWKRVSEQKDAHRDRLAALPYAEKLQMVERLRERTREMGGPLWSVKARHASASNAYVALLPAHAPHAATTTVNAMLFGIASAFANAMAPSRAAIGTMATRRAEHLR